MSSGHSPDASPASEGSKAPPVRRLVDLALTDALSRHATWLEFRLEAAGVAVYYGLAAGPTHAMQIPPSAAPSILNELLGRLGKAAGTPLPVSGALTIHAPDGPASAQAVVALRDGIPVARLAIAGQTASTGPAAAT